MTRMLRFFLAMIPLSFIAAAWAQTSSVPPADRLPTGKEYMLNRIVTLEGQAAELLDRIAAVTSERDQVRKMLAAKPGLSECSNGWTRDASGACNGPAPLKKD